MNKRLPFIIAGICLMAGVAGAIITVISVGPARQPIPNFIDSGRDQEKGKEMLADYKDRLDAHLDSGAPFIDAFFSEIRLVDFSTVGIKQDHVLADLGCGVGTLPLALLTQEIPFKKVYALDVNKFSLEFLRYALDEGGLSRANKIFPKRSKYTDITLHDNVLDILFIVEVPAIYYSLTKSGHYDGDEEAFARMEKLFTSIRQALKSDGELHFIYPTETPTSGNLNPDALVAALDAVGFRLVQQSVLMLQVENYYFIFAQKESRQSKRAARVPAAIQ